ncbi:MAG: N-acetylmuramoyl-L-alanine amidase, partial [Actinomycetota bacterium]
TGISLMGTFTSTTPSSAMQSALKRVLAWKLDVHHVPPAAKVTMTSGGNPKYPAGKRVTFNRISGHRDGQQTACPGAKAYYLLPSIRKAVNAMGLPKIYLPTQSSTVLRPDGDTKNEAVTVRATFSASLSWSVEFLTVGGSGVLRKFSGYGTSLTATWNGRSPTGELTGYTGAVPVRITAGKRSTVARPASLLTYVVIQHPNGTVLRTPTRTVVIEDGDARLVPSPLVLNSWYRAAEPVATTDVEVDRYPAGSPLELRDGTLLKEPDNTYAIFSNGKVREFDTGIYEALKYTAASALPITADELAGLPSGQKISDATRHPEGAVVRASDGSVWTIDTALRHRNPTVTVWRSRYRDAEIVPANLGDVALPLGPVMTYREGTLLKGSDGTIWIYADGTKSRFYDASLYAAMGYSTAALLAITTTEGNGIPNGPLIA